MKEFTRGGRMERKEIEEGVSHGDCLPNELNLLMVHTAHDFNNHED
jgi:hypothetical protein